MCFEKMDSRFTKSRVETSRKFILISILLAWFGDGFFVEGTRPSCGIPLGMEDGRIKDNQLKAYSYDTGYYAKNGRLNGNAAWCSDSETAWTDYFQIRLDRIRHVSGIGIQGLKSSGLFSDTYWVRSFALSYSYDGVEWYWYKDSLSSSSGIKIFPGNSDATTESRISFRETFVAKYLKIFPTDFKNDMCLRVEVYGCPNGKDCTKELTGPSGLISSPDYPLNYPVGIDCTWLIHVSDRSKNIAAYFRYMDVNGGSSILSCIDDYITARDGLLDISYSLGEFCNGEETPIIESTDSSMSIYFHSSAKSSPRKGFQMAYYAFTKGVDDVYRAVACSGSSVSLNCSSRSRQSIKILYAFYGVFPFSTHCGSRGHNSSCEAPRVQQKLKTLCRHLKVCKVDISGPDFGLNCGAGSVPRLVVFYQCTGTSIRTLPPSTTTATLPPTTQTTTLPTDQTTTTPPPLPPQTQPPVPLSTSSSPMTTGRSSPSTPTASATGKELGDQLAHTGRNNGSGLVIGIVVAVILLVIVVVGVLVCIMYRRRKRKDKLPRTVTYTAAGTTEDTMPPPFSRDGRSSSRSNAYETVNVLYVSADDARCKDRPMEHIYDSPELHEPLPQMTDNPLYHGGLELDSAAAYESIDPQDPSDSRVPPSLDPAIYDSPLPVTIPKSGTAKSISNPNYGKTIEIPEK